MINARIIWGIRGMEPFIRKYEVKFMTDKAKESYCSFVGSDSMDNDTVTMTPQTFDDFENVCKIAGITVNIS